MKKRITSVVLSACMLLSCVAVGSFSTQAAEVTGTEAVSSGSQEPLDHIQGANILHCFDWSYNSIKANLKDIKDAGYTAVQTSPVQTPKDYKASYTDQSGQWWKLYQPTSFNIADGNTWLGTKAELKELCTEAENYGIKVIVDIVANHMADVDGSGNTKSNISSQIETEVRSNDSYWHLNSSWANNDNDRYAMTQGSIGQPDVNTGSSYIQNRVKNLLIDCINQGVDGFRFDTAKHIELPTDSGFGSQFWPTVVNGSQSSTSNQIFYYGEVLNGCATDISNYTKYISVTDNYSGDTKLYAANTGNAESLADSNYAKGAGANKTVLWVESHDTYMGSTGSGGYQNTKNISDASIVKAWAMVGSRADASSLFLARPAAKMGDASTDTTWKSKAVSEVNKFKNYFDGESEYLSSSGSVAYNERGTSGVVIAKLDGAGSVNITAKRMQDGTYTDQITGNEFKVSNGKISGTVGSTGVAVVYNAVNPGPTASAVPGTSSYKTDTLTITLNYKNGATSGWYSINGGAYKSFTNGEKITIGADAAYGTYTTLNLKASDGTTTSDIISYRYKKTDPSSVQKIYFDNSSYNWSSVYAYIYSDGTTKNASWPGEKMTLDSSTGYYSIEVPDNLADGYVIFTESNDSTTNRYPADMQPGLSLNSKSMLLKANNEWVEYSAVTPTVQPTTATEPTTTVQPTTATEPTTTVQPTTTEPTTTTPTPVIKVLIGDVDNDGIVSIKDATIIQRYLNDTATVDNTDKFKLAADTNGDGNIDIMDVTTIQYYLAGNNENSGNCGKYTGEEDPTTEPTEATEPTTQPENNFVYFKNTSNWSNVMAYYWNTEDTTLTSWPGVAMTNVGDNVYRAEVPSTATNIIFNNGGSGQTGDITLCGYGKIYENGSWSDYSESSETESSEATVSTASGDSYTITFTNNKNWSNVNCYYWSKTDSKMTVWPGTQMTYSSTNELGEKIYTIEIPSSAEYIIFNNGGNSQTVNISVIGSAKYYISGSSGSGSAYTVETWK